MQKVINICDRCGKESIGHWNHPTGWAHVHYEIHLAKPTRDGAMHERQGYHVCDDCVGAFKAFLKGKK